MDIGEIRSKALAGATKKELVAMFIEAGCSQATAYRRADAMMQEIEAEIVAKIQGKQNEAIDQLDLPRIYDMLMRVIAWTTWAQRAIRQDPKADIHWHTMAMELRQALKETGCPMSYIEAAMYSGHDSDYDPIGHQKVTYEAMMEREKKLRID